MIKEHVRLMYKLIRICLEWKMMNYQQCLTQLSDTTSEVINQIPTTLKPIPGTNEKGRLDPRVVEQRLKPKKDPEVIDSTMFEDVAIGRIRQGMGFNNLDITVDEIRIEEQVMNGVKVRLYRPNQIKDLRPAFIFIHGGGFYGGDLEVVENPCKAIAEKANVMVISVDYTLAPEGPYPQGLNDCDSVVDYVYENARALGIDSTKISISGDSAGGNLAAGCVLRDIQKGRYAIQYMALLYPVVLLSDEDVADYEWSLDQYDVKENDELVTRAIHSIKNCMPLITRLYVQDSTPLEHPELSPLLVEDLSQFPKTLIITAEYDFLRIQGEAYAKRLSEAGVDVRLIRYEGMDHAFLDKCGVYPQAEDCLNEITKDLKLINY